MAGQATFFNGQLLAEINVGGSPFGKAQGESADQNSAPKQEGGPRGRRGGGMGGGERPERSNDDQAQPARTRLTPMGPLVMIHLRFTNHSAAPLEVHIREFNSPLGNFAVQPEKLVIAAGQSLETDSMSSPTDGSLVGITAQLTLQVDKQVESQAIQLRQVTAKPGPNPPAN